MINFGDYPNFYLLIDVLLLADVLENFRDACLQHYGLDPAHNYTSPGLSWQELDILTDIDQNLLIKQRIKGGVPMISHQYTWVNAPGMENYNASKWNSYIMHLDANHLHG